MAHEDALRFPPMRGKQEIGTQGGAGIMKFTVDPTYLDEKAAAWWKAKTPAMRGVLMQAVYELETSARTAQPTHLSEGNHETEKTQTHDRP